MRTASHWKTWLGVSLLSAIVLGSIGGAAPVPPPGAGAALRKFQAASAAADAERDRAVERARATLVTDLKAAQKAALEAGDVDAATALAALAKEHAAPAAGRQTFVGAKFSAFDWQVTLLPDGTIKHSDPRFGGRWTFVGDRAVAIQFNHGWIDVWTIDPAGKKFAGAAHKPDNNYGGTVDR